MGRSEGYADEHYNQGMFDEDKGGVDTFLSFTCIGKKHTVANEHGSILGVIEPVVDTHIFNINQNIMLTTEHMTTIGEYMRGLDD